MSKKNRKQDSAPAEDPARDPRVPTARIIQIAPLMRPDGGTDVWYLFDNGEVWVGQQGAVEPRKVWPTG